MKTEAEKRCDAYVRTGVSFCSSRASSLDQSHRKF
jgi:hypothetical protein